jgi:hypothetical protein
VNQAHLDDAPRGARIADSVTGFMGSWRFLIIQSIFVLIWIGGNIVLLFHFDPFPFILLNLAFSTQAAYAAPLILLAGNRQAARDRATLEHTAKEADEEFEQNLELLRRTESIVERIERMERVVLAISDAVLREVVTDDEKKRTLDAAAERVQRDE